MWTVVIKWAFFSAVLVGGAAHLCWKAVGRFLEKEEADAKAEGRYCYECGGYTKKELSEPCEYNEGVHQFKKDEDSEI